MAYIYIIYSEQFGIQNYKVGYTKNPYSRIKDSCYTTTYFKPCEYICLWKYKIDEKYNSICIEQELHSHLQNNRNIVYLYKEGINNCKEMYHCDIFMLTKIIDLYFENHKIINNYKFYDKKIWQSQIIKEDFKIKDCFFENIIEIAKIKGNIRIINNKYNKCNRCNKSHFRISYEVALDNKKYYFGCECYNKLDKDTIEKDKSNSYDKYGPKCNNIAIFNENIKTGLIKYIGFRILEIESEKELIDLIDEKIVNIDTKYFRCKCCFDYGLYLIMKSMINKDIYFISEEKFNIICNKIEKLYDDKFKEYVTFKDYILNNLNFKYKLENNKLIDITKEHQYTFIKNYFNEISDSEYKYKPCDYCTIYNLKCKQCLKNKSPEFTTYNKGILLGSAGTGKTTQLFGMGNLKERVPSAIDHYLIKENLKILVLAPTGKAINEIKTKLKKDGEYEAFIDDNDKDNDKRKKTLDCIYDNIYTIDRYISAYESKKEIYDLIIIDEISMIPLHKMYKILQIPTKHIIIMGDFNQLPPVKYPSIKTVLFNDNITTELKKIHRSSSECLKDMYVKSRNINFRINNLLEYKNPLRDETNKVIIKTEEYSTDIDIEKILNKTISRIRENKDSNFIKILVPTNYLLDKVYGLYKIKKNDIDFNKKIPGINQNFMYTKNIYKKGKLVHFNGENISNECLKNDFDDKNKDKCLRSEIITVHKSQGSGFDNVIIILENNIDHAKMYTAITRAKDTITFIIPKQKEQNNNLLLYHELLFYTFKKYRNGHIKCIKDGMKSDIDHFFNCISTDKMKVWARSINADFLKLVQNKDTDIISSIKKYEKRVEEFINEKCIYESFINYYNEN